MKKIQMRNKGSFWVPVLTVFVIMSSHIATASAADSDKDAKREAKRAQAQFAAAQKENSVLASEILELKKKLSDLGSKSGELEKKSGGQKRQFSELTEKYNETEKNLQQMTLQFAEASKSLQQLQIEKEQEQKQLSGSVQLCERKNLQLFQISTELMDKYKSKGVFSALLQAEPFTQLEKVKMDNLLQEYRDKAEAAKVSVNPVQVSIATTDTMTKAQDAPRL
jgi:chromosome segregation ATPase